mgnify:CR=1 FL=1
MELTLESQGYLESLYRAYLEDPLSHPEDWRRYFSALTLESFHHEMTGHEDAFGNLGLLRGIDGRA